MRSMIPATLLATSLLAATLIAGAAPARAPSTPDRLLAGRAAGPPEQCISQSRIVDTQTFDDGSIFYRMSGRVDYLNRPRQCGHLDSNTAYVTDTHSNYLCAGDSLRVVDLAARIPYGSCLFDDFIPYARRK